MKKYIIGFVLGLSTVSIISFAIDHSDIDFGGAHYSYGGFKYEVERIIESYGYGYGYGGFEYEVERIIESCEIVGTEISC